MRALLHAVKIGAHVQQMGAACSQGVHAHRVPSGEQRKEADRSPVEKSIRANQPSCQRKTRAEKKEPRQRGLKRKSVQPDFRRAHQPSSKRRAPSLHRYPNLYNHHPQTHPSLRWGCRAGRRSRSARSSTRGSSRTFLCRQRRRAPTPSSSVGKVRGVGNGRNLGTAGERGGSQTFIWTADGRRRRRRANLVDNKRGVGARPVEVGRLYFSDKLRHGKLVMFARHTATHTHKDSARVHGQKIPG